jgi:EAL domain-containing protein (putative c-di-GMP-specific phosphodiesterase class I)
MTCECRTGARTLAVLAPGFDAYPELESFGASRDWVLHPALGAVEVAVGPEREWGGVAEVASFLSAVLDADRYAGLRAVWLRSGVPIEQQFVELLHAQPLADVAAVDSTPLAGVLDEGRLETWFQPVFWRGTLALWGYECLVRGRTAEGETIGAGQLLDWARQERQVFRLDRVCRELHLASAGAAGITEDAQILINFLPTAIYRPEFCLASTMRAAAQAGISPDRIVFEVVETERVPDMAHLQRILQFYRDRGFRVALDDVGSGWSGLSLLAELRPDLVKIDRHLVSQAPHSPAHRDPGAAGPRRRAAGPGGRGGDGRGVAADGGAGCQPLPGLPVREAGARPRDPVAGGRVAPRRPARASAPAESGRAIQAASKGLKRRSPGPQAASGSFSSSSSAMAAASSAWLRGLRCRSAWAWWRRACSTSSP